MENQQPSDKPKNKNLLARLAEEKALALKNGTAKTSIFGQKTNGRFPRPGNSPKLHVYGGRNGNGKP